MSNALTQDAAVTRRSRLRAVAGERDFLANIIAVSVLHGRDPVSYAKVLQQYGQITAEYDRLVLDVRGGTIAL